MDAVTRFTPAQPPREPDWIPEWRSMVGKRVKNAVWGICDPIFDLPYKWRKVLHMPVLVVNDPEMIGHYLLGNHANYPRPPLTRKILAPLLGDSLFNTEGDSWRTQRHLMAPTFAPSQVVRMAQMMAQEAERQRTRWPQGRRVIDMAQIATDTTMAIISSALFSGDERLTSPVAASHIRRVVTEGGQPNLFNMLGLGDYDPAPSAFRRRASARYLRDSLRAMVLERGTEGGAADFFGGLIRAFHQALPPEEAVERAVDNAATFYVAGHETTAVTLAWSAYLLAGQPELQELLRAEAMAAWAGDPAAITANTPLLRQFLDETLRLYPPALQLIRQALEDDDICGVPVRKGEIVTAYPWIVHRHRQLWENPDSFDLNRFAPANREKLHRFQFLPFGAGPRICIGAQFAVSEALVILASWLASCRFRLPEGLSPMPYGTIVLRPKDGMPLIVEAL